MYLQIASGCILDCYMCSEHNRPPETRHGRDLVSLAPELFEKIAADVFPCSRRLTIGMGGEPTLSPHFLEFVERAWSAGQEITVLTNGTRLDQPGMAETIARCVSLLQVSLDGATRETNERIRLGWSWSAIRAKLALVNELRLKDAPEARTQLSLQYVVMQNNVHELPAFVDFAREFHADKVEFQHVIPVTEEGKREPLIGVPERFNHFRELTLARARQLGLDVLMPSPYPVHAAEPPRATPVELDQASTPSAFSGEPRSESPDGAPRRVLFDADDADLRSLRRPRVPLLPSVRTPQDAGRRPAHAELRGDLEQPHLPRLARQAAQRRRARDLP